MKVYILKTQHGKILAAFQDPGVAKNIKELIASGIEQAARVRDSMYGASSKKEWEMAASACNEEVEKAFTAAEFDVLHRYIKGPPYSWRDWLCRPIRLSKVEVE